MISGQLPRLTVMTAVLLFLQMVYFPTGIVPFWTIDTFLLLPCPDQCFVQNWVQRDSHALQRRPKLYNGMSVNTGTDFWMIVHKQFTLRERLRLYICNISLRTRYRERIFRDRSIGILWRMPDGNNSNSCFRRQRGPYRFVPDRGTQVGTGTVSNLPGIDVLSKTGKRFVNTIPFRRRMRRP